MSSLFDGTQVSGRISPGEFMLESGKLGVAYGQLFNQAYQSSAERKMKADQGAWPAPRDGRLPTGNAAGEAMFPGGFGTDEG